MGARSGKSGPDPREPTDRERLTVVAMVGAGIPQETIAKCLGMSVPTLVLKYRAELDGGVHEANAMVSGSLFKKALSDDHPQAATCAIFWLKTRARWKETSEHQHTGAGGKELTVYTGVVRDQPDEAP